MSRKFVYKVLTAGEGGVGKTTLLHKYIKDEFLMDTKMTIGVEFFVKEIEMNGINFTLQLWDFGGQDRFRFMLENYVAGAKGAFLMFDLTRVSSLSNIEEWVGILRKTTPTLPILLIGTKLDLEDEIVVDDDFVEDMLLTEHNFFDYIKVSSKTGENVNKAVERLVLKILHS